jgi:hypothetical protein
VREALLFESKVLIGNDVVHRCRLTTSCYNDRQKYEREKLKI